MLTNEAQLLNTKYCNSLTQYSRRQTVTVAMGDLPMGSDFPIRLQSMTTVDTMDTLGSVEQCIRMIEAGSEYIRITAPSLKEAENLQYIKKELNLRGYKTPLIADIHFTPNAAELAARLVEKVRINPGNYADKKRFENIEYTDATYESELQRIRERFLPLLKICKEYGTAMRIGTNHGSLSDRILSRYGDTPLGMVESALEFLRICEDENYYNIAISMKASNTQVMVQAYRLLVQKLDEEGFKPYPLHLGVTEAGEAEDGRIKSAVGIGTLLEDGLGDTVRVSLTEDPEFEIPVARALVERYTHRTALAKPIDLSVRLSHTEDSVINPFQYFRRKTHEVANFGAGNVPRVIADLSKVTISEKEDLRAIGHFYLPLLDKWKMNDLGADYVYAGKNPIPFMLANGSREILDFEVWQSAVDKINTYPMLSATEFKDPSHNLHPQLNFVQATITDFDTKLFDLFANSKNTVLCLETANEHAMPELRQAFFALIERNISTPVVILRQFTNISEEQLLLYAATDGGGLLIEGLGDGIMLGANLVVENDKAILLKKAKFYNETAFGILQAARTRMSKTEYISCPSCGRTLFDLQEVTAMIRKRTDHLKGVKIGIMGCIVNGPGEMADADYGYVGSGVGKITLYRGQNVVKKSVASEKALDELIKLIAEDKRWFEPETVNS
ncbi:MAG: (E)-4-hydroxy-3-methylbut-2-enyl-diphosphate synthase [Verrucomicrobia bacterium]|nr:(E)-4-hydroxy-3-methylbut-2-enyl-diphosphate synthase [Cytophagales bacterium]